MIIKSTKQLMIVVASGALLTLSACAGGDQRPMSESQHAAMSEADVHKLLSEHEIEMQRMLQKHHDEMQKMMQSHEEMDKTIQNKKIMQQHRDEMQKIMQNHVEMEKMLQRHREALKKAVPSRSIPSKPGSPQHSY